VNSFSKPEYPEFKPFLALIFFGYICAFFLQIGSRIDIFRTVRLEFSLALVLLIVAFTYNSRIKYPPSKIAGLIGVYLFFVVIQIPLSMDVSYSYDMFVDRFLKFSVMAIFIAKFVDNPKMVLVFLAGYLLSCFKMGEEGFVGNITGSMVWQNQGVMRLHGSTRMYAHPNSFAGMALGTMPFIYYLYPLYGKHIKIFLLIMLVFAINIVIFSASRTGYVGFFMLAMFVFWHSQYKNRFILITILAAIPAIMFMPEQYVGRFSSIFTGKEAEGRSTEARLTIIQNALAVFAKHPLGVGVAAFPVARERYYGLRQDTHNLYLEVATNLGIQGLIVFLLLFWAVAKGYSRLRSKLHLQIEAMQSLPDPPEGEARTELQQHKKNLKLYLAVCCAVYMYLMLRLVLGIFGHDLYEIYWWIVLGFLFSLQKLNFIAEKITANYQQMSNGEIATL